MHIGILCLRHLSCIWRRQKITSTVPPSPRKLHWDSGNTNGKTCTFIQLSSKWDVFFQLLKVKICPYIFHGLSKHLSLKKGTILASHKSLAQIYRVSWCSLDIVSFPLYFHISAERPHFPCACVIAIALITSCKSGDSSRGGISSRYCMEPKSYSMLIGTNRSCRKWSANRLRVSDFSCNTEVQSSDVSWSWVVLRLTGPYIPVIHCTMFSCHWYTLLIVDSPP